MKDLAANTTGKFKRTPVRLSSKDKQLLDRVLAQTDFSSRSDVVRAALAFLRDVWKEKDGGSRIVLRNERANLQYELFLVKISAEGLERRGGLEKLKQAEANLSRAELLRSGGIFEFRTFPADLQVLDDLTRQEIAPTQSQLIRTALDVYGHVVGRCLEGYQVAAQRLPSRELVYLSVPGVRSGGDRKVVYLVNDRLEDRSFLVEGFRIQNIATVSYVYEQQLGPDANLLRALEKAHNMVRQGVRVFHVDLCWAFREEVMGSDYIDPVEWGVVEGDDPGELVATFGGFKFIEAIAWEPWSRDIRVVLLTKRLDELRSRLTSAGLHYEDRLSVFEDNIRDRFAKFKMYSSDVDAVEEESFRDRAAAQALVDSWASWGTVESGGEKPERGSGGQLRGEGAAESAGRKEMPDVESGKKEELANLGARLFGHTRLVDRELIQGST